MDEEMEVMEDLVIDDDSCSEIFDPDYEFDACQFFDFSRDETESEAEDADQWFRYAHEYPPSPFVVKLKMMKASKENSVKDHKTNSQKIEADESTSTSSSLDYETDREVPSTKVKTNGMKNHKLTAEDIKKCKTRSAVKSSKPSSSTLMKPTASHLAKQNKGREVKSSGRGRSQKPLVKEVERLQSPPGGEILATKRQKLEIGYLRKVGHLKHQASFLHKLAKKVAQLEVSPKSRSKTTIPRKPALVTEERARRRRSRRKSEPGQQQKANTHAFKARPMNRKILASPSLPQRKKSMPQLTEFQEFHLKTTERAMQHQSANVLNRHNSTSALQSEDVALKRQSSGKNQKRGSSNKIKARATDKVYPIKEGGSVLNAKQESDLPPVELFKKLSLKSESDTKPTSPLKPHRLTKASKENAPARSFQQVFGRCPGKPNQYASDKRIAEAKTQANLNRWDETGVTFKSVNFYMGEKYLTNV